MNANLEQQLPSDYVEEASLEDLMEVLDDLELEIAADDEEEDQADDESAEIAPVVGADPPKVKYLTNKEFLLEIHRSKLSYCVYDTEAHAYHDAIVATLDDITPELVEATRIRKAHLQTQARKVALRAQGASQSELKACVVNPATIATEDIVFRVMTSQHVPLDPERKRKGKGENSNHRRTSFLPFKHYIKVNGEWKEVLRSHWVGTLQDGHFDMHRGQMTNRLAVMFMLLVDRYSRRSNWRGYCVDATTQALTNQGWLSMDQITADNRIVSYADGELKWSSIKSIYRGDYDGLMHRMTAPGFDAFITPEHKMVTDQGLVKVELLTPTDNIVLMGNLLKDDPKALYSDNFVKLVGYMASNSQFDDGAKTITLTQNSRDTTDDIIGCLDSEGCTYSELIIPQSDDTFQSKIVVFDEIYSDISEIAPDGEITLDFVLNLSSYQRGLLMTVMTNKDSKYITGNKALATLFQTLCCFNGRMAIIVFDETTSQYTVDVLPIESNSVNVAAVYFDGGSQTGPDSTNAPMTPYKGMVWCPETEYGCFIAKRNDTVYLTGNTYLDEMKSHSLMQLSQVGLQFNEAVSENPFAFYTSILRNAFTRVLNLEKKNQNIRDDILIMHGASPSYTRQNDEDHARALKKFALDTNQQLSEPVSDGIDLIDDTDD